MQETIRQLEQRRHVAQRAFVYKSKSPYPVTEAPAPAPKAGQAQPSDTLRCDLGAVLRLGACFTAPRDARCAMRALD